MENHDDFAFEPVRGLPAELPRGERLIWQGAPDWRLLAIQAFHVRKVAIYFLIVGLWQWTAAMSDGAGPLAALSGLWVLALLAVGSLAILSGLAWFYARATVYSLTSRRIVIRSGLALPVTLNLPLTLIGTATVARGPGESGGIAFEVAKPNRVAWLVAWPNARPWRFNNPQPMFRALRDVGPVTALVADALSTTAATGRVRPVQRAPQADEVLQPGAGQPA